MVEIILSALVFAGAAYCVYLAVRGPIRDILTGEAERSGLKAASIFFAAVILSCALILVCLGLYFLRIGG